MSYQTVTEHSLEGTKPYKTGLIISVALLSVCIILISIYLVQRQNSRMQLSTAATPPKSETLDTEAKSQAQASPIPEIDFAALASETRLAPAPSLARSEQTSTNTSSKQASSSNGNTPQDLLNSLQISAVTHSKAVINGIVYHQGDYINREQTIQLHSIQNGVLYFKSKDQSFAYRVEN